MNSEGRSELYGGRAKDLETVKASLPKRWLNGTVTTVTTNSGDKWLKARGRGSRKMKPMATF